MLRAFEHAIYHYFTFSGRDNRAQFWWFQLSFYLLMVITTVIDIIIFRDDLGPFSTVSALALQFPLWATTVRRLHDTGRSVFSMLILASFEKRVARSLSEK